MGGACSTRSIHEKCRDNRVGKSQGIQNLGRAVIAQWHSGGLRA
jgi:hypothetical protein